MTAEFIERMINAGVKDVTINFTGEKESEGGSVSVSVKNLKDLNEKYGIDAFEIACDAFIQEIEKRKK